MNPRIYLLDAMSFIHRAYHGSMVPGRPPMTTKVGLPTGGIFFFNQMLKKLQTELNPTYLVACCDVEGPTWQDELAKQMPVIHKWSKKGIEKIPYLGYKAGRDEHSSDFLAQVPYIYRLFEAYGIPVCALEGYEADDLLGSLARIVVSEDQNRQVSILTHDKDMLQLVTARVFVMNPDKGVFTPNMVREHVGVLPEQIPDLMALRGDTSDNVPGCPGIGDKGSVELIQMYGDIDELYRKLDEIKKNSYRESLRLNEQVVRLSKQLVTINCYAPCQTQMLIQSMKIQPTNQEKLSALMAELEFRIAPQNGVEFGLATNDENLLELDMTETM